MNNRSDDGSDEALADNTQSVVPGDCTRRLHRSLFKTEKQHDTTLTV